MGSGRTGIFWNSSWLHGLRLRDITRRISALSCKKNDLVQQALTNNFWISHIDISNGLTLDHVQQFANLWGKFSSITLEEEVEDSIVWKFTKYGLYSASSTYKAQFEGLTTSVLVHPVWKVWIPPRCKFFDMLGLQHRIWTSDRLIRRGRSNYVLCPLCTESQESAASLLLQCRFTLRVGNGYSPVVWHAPYQYNYMDGKGLGEGLVDRKHSHSVWVSQGTCLFDDAHLMGDLVRAQC